ncbi:MAG: oxidoreductase, partial [Candidatus Limosilactobacillus intestinavium]
MVKAVQFGKSAVVANPLGLGTNAVGGHNLFPGLDDGAGRKLV